MAPDRITPLLHSIEAVFGIAPYVKELQSFFQDEVSRIAVGQTPRIPVSAIRFTQSTFSKSACFRHDLSDRWVHSEEEQRSMYELLDGLVRGASKTEDIHLNVTLWDHQLFSKDNRRLVVLLMFQALRLSLIHI